ncbi:MAG: mercury methylation ferredoxin HgcB [Methanoregula sp.]|jgi:NAD-dependent dihydropyrimidine dehydrogenase PreA subunit
MFDSYRKNTLELDAERCINCGICQTVCPHAVFAAGKKGVILAAPEACMECGACMKNCPVSAISVESGVGCAEAMIRQAITGSKTATCGCGGEGESSCCCGGENE